MAGVFLSYRSTDAAIGALYIDEKLVAEFGEKRVFRDSRSIPAGTNYKPFLWDWLRRSDVVLALMGPHWNERDEDGRMLLDDPDDFIHRELVEALNLTIKVVPVLLGPVPKLVASELPTDLAPLADFQYRRFDSRNGDYDMPRLIDTVAEFLGADTAKVNPKRSAAQRADTIVNGNVRGDGSAMVIGGGTATYNAAPPIAGPDSATRRYRGPE